MTMGYELDTVDVWAGTIDDKPGGLAEKLEALVDAGANLQFVIARRDQPGTGVVFCAPISGTAEIKAAKQAGLTKSDSLRSLRLEGPDRPGAGAQVTRAIADAGVSLRGLSAGSIGRKSVFYFAFDTREDMNKARNAIKQALGVK